MATNKSKNGAPEKGVHIHVHVPSFVHGGIEAGRKHLQEIEEQASELFEGLRARGYDELRSLRESLPAPSIRENLPIDHLIERSREVETEALERAGSLAAKVEQSIDTVKRALLDFAGIASRDDVAAIDEKLERLSKRLDRLARQARSAGSDRQGKKKPANKTKTSEGSGGKPRGSTPSRPRKPRG